MFFTFDQITGWFVQYGYFVFFLVDVLEGPIVTILAAFMASLGYFNVFIVYFVSLAGDLVGDTLYYSIGRWGRVGFIKRWGKYVGLTAVRVETLEAHFHKHGNKTLLFGKWSQVLGAPILASAGMAGMPYLKFIGVNLVGSVPKCILWVVIGYYFGEAYESINRYFNYAAYFVMLLVALGAVVYFLYIRKKVVKS